MTITVNSPIVGTGGTVEAALGFLVDTDAEDRAYAHELHRLCEATGLDFRIVWAQFCIETGNATSARWMANRNPAGLAVEKDTDPDPAHFTGKQAAAVHVWALLIATDAPESAFERLPPYPFGPETDFYQRWVDKYEDENCPTVRTVADLQRRYVDSHGEAQATWAWDEDYADKIVAKANRIFPEGETMPTQPVMYDLMRDYARYGISQEDAATVRGYRFENRNGHKPTFIVLHIQAGTTRSSLDWWANGYDRFGNKITASSTVMIQKDGSILQVIPEQHAPWTNGDDKAPTPTGQRLVNLPGNSNLHTLSVEAEGMHGGEVLANPKQLDAIEWQVRDWITRYGIPVENVIRHGDINSVDRPNCPGAYYPEIVKRLKAGSGSTYAAPDPPPWERGDVGMTTLGDAKAVKLTAELTATARTQPRKYASGTSERTGPAIEIGQKIVVIGALTVPGAPGKRPSYWYIRADGSRVRASAFTPRLPFV